jgi:hypothetical protein
MRRNPDDWRSGASPVTAPQMDYSLNRLTAAVNELSRLTENKLASAVERALTEVDNAVDYTSTGIQAAHKLRLWRADYLRLTAELEAATRSFHLIEQGLSRRIEAALADWEGRFEATGLRALEQRTALASRSGWLRGRFGQGQAQQPPTAPTAPPSEPPGLIVTALLAHNAHPRLARLTWPLARFYCPWRGRKTVSTPRKPLAEFGAHPSAAVSAAVVDAPSVPHESLTCSGVASQ